MNRFTRTTWQIKWGTGRRNVTAVERSSAVPRQLFLPNVIDYFAGSRIRPRWVHPIGPAVGDGFGSSAATHHQSAVMMGSSKVLSPISEQKRFAMLMVCRARRAHSDPPRPVPGLVIGSGYLSAQ